MAVSHSFVKGYVIVTLKKHKGIGNGRHTYRLPFYPDDENGNFNFLCTLFHLPRLEYAAKVVKCRSEGPRLGEHILVSFHHLSSEVTLVLLQALK